MAGRSAPAVPLGRGPGAPAAGPGPRGLHPAAAAVDAGAAVRGEGDVRGLKEMMQPCLIYHEAISLVALTVILVLRFAEKMLLLLEGSATSAHVAHMDYRPT